MRTLRLLWQFARIGLMIQTAYPPSFFLAILGKSLRVGTLLVFFQAVYLYTPALGDWTPDSILVLLAAYLTLEFLVMISFHRNLAYYLPDHLRKGTFDFVLTKPVNPLFYTAFRVIDFMDLVSFIPVLVLWVAVLSRLAPTLTVSGVLLFFLLLAAGYVIMFSYLVFFTSTAFWTITATGIGRLYENLFRLGRYPEPVFRGGLRFVLLYLLPVVAVVGTPAAALRGIVAWQGVLILLAIAAVSLTLALTFWRFALRHYSSASS